LLGIPEVETVTSLMVARRSERYGGWCLKEGFRISSTWLTESQLVHWPISVIDEREEEEKRTGKVLLPWLAVV
jgi:hypothetical protein